MPYFRKKPVLIEAHRLPIADDPTQELIDFLHSIDREWGQSDKHGSIIIKTFEGDMHAEPGDWIIKGVNGEFYPCKPDIFAKTYQEITEAI